MEAIIDSFYAGTIIYPEKFANMVFEEKAEEIFNSMIGSVYLEVSKNACMGFCKVEIEK